MIYVLDFRAADIGGPVLPGRIIKTQDSTGSEDQLQRESKITFLLHGYNVSRQRGRELLFQLANFFSSTADGGIVIVLWPGDHWARAISYPLEGKDADDTAIELARYIDRVVQPNTELSFVSHSLGTRVVMGTVKRLIGYIKSV